MFLKVITVTWLTMLSSVENQQQPPKYAVSSQSFHRDDVPLSYKYSAVHVVYTTAKPRHIHRKRPNEGNQQNNYYTIQYAPLHAAKIEAINSQNNKKSDYKLMHQDNRKEHLEPKKNSERNHKIANKQIIPGYNIEMLQTNNINPGHNTVYRDSVQNVQHKKANRVQHRLLNMNSKPSHSSEDNTTNAWTSTTEIPPNVYTLLERQNFRTHLLEDDGISDIQRTKIPHPKAHRLHLNIARQYGVAQMIPVAANHILDPSNLEQSQIFMYLPQSAKTQQSIEKTQLYPVQSKNKNFLINIAS